MYLKSILLVFALSVGPVASSFANEVESAAGVEFSTHDVALLFESSGSGMEVAALEAEEMRDTDGALRPYVIGGGAGLVTYTYSNWDTWNAPAAAYATGIGAITGGAAGALAGLSGGGLAGAVAWRPGFMALNYGAQKANPW